MAYDLLIQEQGSIIVNVKLSNIKLTFFPWRLRNCEIENIFQCNLNRGPINELLRIKTIAVSVYIAGNMYSGSERSSAKNKKHCCRLLRSPLVSTFATAHSRTSYGCSLQFIIIQFYFVCKFDILCDCIFV